MIIAVSIDSVRESWRAYRLVIITYIIIIILRKRGTTTTIIFIFTTPGEAVYYCASSYPFTSLFKYRRILYNTWDLLHFMLAGRDTKN